MLRSAFEDAVDAGEDFDFEEIFRKRQAEKAAQLQKSQQELVKRIMEGIYED